MKPIRWLLADGATGPYFDLLILLANPSAQAADVRLRFLLGDGTVRALRSRSLEGMEVTEGTPVVGVAVGEVDDDSGLVPVYVLLP